MGLVPPTHWPARRPVRARVPDDLHLWSVTRRAGRRGRRRVGHPPRLPGPPPAKACSRRRPEGQEGEGRARGCWRRQCAAAAGAVHDVDQLADRNIRAARGQAVRPRPGLYPEIVGSALAGSLRRLTGELDGQCVAEHLSGGALKAEKCVLPRDHDAEPATGRGGGGRGGTPRTTNPHGQRAGRLTGTRGPAVRRQDKKASAGAPVVPRSERFPAGPPRVAAFNGALLACQTDRSVTLEGFSSHSRPRSPRPGAAARAC
jgi:hypothetical protein